MSDTSPFFSTSSSAELKRATFAIISHPDAGKTTMTEKLLWFGQVIHEMGMVKSKSGNFAKSDWMKLEQQRGISITSSVMTFPYQDRLMNLLDTPGHADFSEDTYRTLTAVESALMMIDSAKGVEAQTIKLMEVCRLRDTPIVTFMNKFDRDTLGAFSLFDNVEKILAIECIPMNWPIGDGVNFLGVYDLKSKQITSFKDFKDPHNPIFIDATELNASCVLDFIGQQNLDQLKHDLEMIENLIPPLDPNLYLAGAQTPVFFGSALNNFGVKEMLDFIANCSPAPRAKEVRLPPYGVHDPVKEISPDDSKFSGFVFKIQANMDKNHRDRVAFMRICSGTFKRNQKLFHVRSEKEIKISIPLIFQARDREVTDEAYPGDIIGLHDTGKFQIGDTFTEGEKFMFTGIPNFAPELFMRAVLKDPMKSKQLEKGLNQLSEEGTVQIFKRQITNEKIIGAVGMLQFEVLKFRLEDEYNVPCDYQPYHFIGIRWPKFPDEKTQEEFIATYASSICIDHKKQICLAVKSDWDLKLIMEKNSKIKFYKNSDYR